MRRIYVIRSGGTFDQVYDNKGILIIPDSTEKLPSLKELVSGFQNVCIIQKESFLELNGDDFYNKQHIKKGNIYNIFDSSNIYPYHWVKISEKIKEVCSEDCDGVVITHGTDTLAYTASMLSYMFNDAPIPIVITGSQQPLLTREGKIDRNSDAVKNFVDACITASEDLAGVYVVFNGKIMLGSRVSKFRSKSLDAFNSINYEISINNGKLQIKSSEEPIGRIENGKITLNIKRRKRGNRKVSEKDVKNEINPKVFFLKIFPGINPAIIDKIDELGYDGIVIEAYGIGNIPTSPKSYSYNGDIYPGVPFMSKNEWDISEKLTSWTEKNKPVVITTQCVYEGVHPGLYEVGSIFNSKGVIPAFDMTKEAALTKLMWALGQVKDEKDPNKKLEKVKELMLKNIAGEITDELEEFYRKP